MALHDKTYQSRIPILGQVIKNKKTTTDSITFRLNSDVLKKLVAHAEIQKTSLNVLVNQILSGYVEWEVDSIKAGWIPTQRQILLQLMNALEEKTILKIAETSAESTGKNVIIFMHGKYNLESLLSHIRASSQKSGFNIKEFSDERELQMVVRHDLGWKWSLFNKSYYQTIFHELGQRVILDYTENSLVITVVRE